MHRMVTGCSVWSLAIGVMLSCGQETAAPSFTLEIGDADQVIYGMEHLLTDDGVLRARLLADSAYYFEADRRWELFALTIRFFDETGALASTVVSETGTYFDRTGNMEARGNVLGTTPDSRRLTTEVLSYDRAMNRLIGNVAFTYQSPRQSIAGSAFTARPDFTDFQVTEASGNLGEGPTGAP